MKHACKTLPKLCIRSDIYRPTITEEEGDEARDYTCHIPNILIALEERRQKMTEEALTMDGHVVYDCFIRNTPKHRELSIRDVFVCHVVGEIQLAIKSPPALSRKYGNNYLHLVLSGTSKNIFSKGPLLET